VRTVAELAAARDALVGRVAVVMTMGALHDGHLHLMRVAREHADALMVTIFVNPLQFGPNEDFDRYPRTPESDLAKCAEAGVDLVFMPSVEEVYPPGEAIPWVSAGALGAELEGKMRPGHFDGVVTVVVRLLRLTRPDVALFGQKDAQQLALIRRGVTDLDLPVEIVGVPTVRESDGLAMSSRNRYLDDNSRTVALTLSRALLTGADQATHGGDAVLESARAVLEESPQVSVDYLVLVDEETWEPPDNETRDARLLVAGRIGTTRLIDNVSVVLGTQNPAG
jgi:pantoate--beta-alanine ligase